jgi:psiF repeat
MKLVISAALLSFVIGAGSAWAQTSTPAPTPAPAAAPAAAAPAATDKKAISKSCSDQANAKGLHGKARKKFRSECKHNGGKAS